VKRLATVAGLPVALFFIAAGCFVFTEVALGHPLGKDGQLTWLAVAVLYATFHATDYLPRRKA
jgi:divalent metal cation (Fe/Co/Zn/Cd) transporter